jgi:hypothetical protein
MHRQSHRPAAPHHAGRRSLLGPPNCNHNRS